MPTFDVDKDVDVDTDVEKYALVSSKKEKFNSGFMTAGNLS